MSNGFVDVKKHVLDNVVNHHKKFDYPIIKFLERKPVFCTIWTQSLDASTDGAGWQDVNSPLGATSPLRFIKYNDVVLFGLDPMNAEGEMDETRGLKVSRNAEMLVLPDTVTLKGSDFLTFHHENHNMVYRITKVDGVLVKNRDFSKISFNQFNSVDAGSVDQLNKQTIAEYTMIYENYGGDYKTIIKTESVDKLRILQKNRERINKIYVDTFYDKYVQTLISRNYNTREEYLGIDTPIAYYVPDVVEMIKRTNCVNYKSYSKLMLEHESVMDRRYSYSFDTCILNKLIETGRYKGTDSNIASFVFKPTVFDSCLRPFSVLTRNSPGETILILNRVDNVDYSLSEENKNLVKFDIDADEILNVEECTDDVLDKLESFSVDDTLHSLVYTPLILRKIDEYIGVINGKPLYKYDDIHHRK